jgi:D-3-phosphoglycerate dehydrogenase / 2-oxoglutarate reductase
MPNTPVHQVCLPSSGGAGGGSLLITDPVHPLLIARFTAAGYTCDYQPETNDTAVRTIIHNYEGLIINSKIRVDKAMLDAAVRLRFVGRLGAGMEIIDREYAAEKGVAVHGSPEGNCNAVAEHALGMLLACANNMLRADRQVRNFDWQREQNRGFELMGKTIAILGFGHTGSGFAQKLQGLGMTVLAYDKYLPKGYAKAMDWVIETDYSTIFKTADIVSLHLPLTPETRHLVEEHWLSQFQKNIVLINTSRGNIVKTASLIKNLQNGKIRNACLDVFENEKPNTFSTEEMNNFQKLYSFDNVIVTPHIAGWTHEAKEKMADVLCKKILI